MKEPVVYGFGETVFDIILKEGQVMVAQPGGSVLNALMNLSCLGCRTSLISVISTDKTGDVIAKTIQKQGVELSLVKRTPIPSVVAMAFLDKKNNAEYVFYNKTGREKKRWPMPDFKAGDFFVFGSSASLFYGNREYIKRAIKSAQQKGAFVFYDPNIRSSVAETIPDFRDVARSYIEMADVVRGSRQDFKVIYGTSDKERIIRQSGCRGYCILTDEDKPVICHGPNERVEAEVPVSRIVCTVGAGDAFNAGVIAGLILSGNKYKNIHSLSSVQISEVIRKSITIALKISGGYDNCLKINNR